MDIREDGPDIVPALQDPDGFVGIGRCNDLESGLFHHGHGVHADEAFVLHHQDHWSLTGNRSAHLPHHCNEKLPPTHMSARANAAGNDRFLKASPLTLKDKRALKSF